MEVQEERLQQQKKRRERVASVRCMRVVDFCGCKNVSILGIQRI